MGDTFVDSIDIVMNDGDTTITPAITNLLNEQYGTGNWDRVEVISTE